MSWPGSNASSASILAPLNASGLAILSADQLWPWIQVCYMQKGTTLIILLADGDKSSQLQDIQASLQLSETLSEESQ
jgi:hypothetical protein